MKSIKEMPEEDFQNLMTHLANKVFDNFSKEIKDNFSIHEEPVIALLLVGSLVTNILKRIAYITKQEETKVLDLFVSSLNVAMEKSTLIMKK